MAWLIIHMSDANCLELPQKEQEADDRKRASHLNMSYSDFLNRRAKLLRQKAEIDKEKTDEKESSTI